MEIIGISEDKIKKISEVKKEKPWITKFRLDSYNNFKSLSK